MALQASATTTPTAVSDECFICEFTGFAASEADALAMLAGTNAVTATATEGAPYTTMYVLLYCYLPIFPRRLEISFV